MLSCNKVIEIFYMADDYCNFFVHVIILEHSPENNNR